MTNAPPCGQAQPTSSKPSGSKPPETTTTTGEETTLRKVPRTKAAPWNTPNPHSHNSLANARRDTTVSHSDMAQKNELAKQKYHMRKSNNNKRPRLPENVTISKRPLLHPAIPTPFASAASPKVLYITASSPFIPTCKRIRALLVQIQKRSAQSAAEGRGRRRGNQGKPLEANGRLEARDVEASIADDAQAKAKGKGAGRGVGGEEVYLKATGRAIPRALELGVKFQGEEDCRVRVELGSVKAIDDVEMATRADGEGEGEGERDGGEEEEVPETRIRTLSTVTVCIGLM